ncbi:IS3 family transposase [Clostridium sp. HCS.1]|uniref:IS3 family transposase n=1 Tax=Clostridium sp. HCS.1 TaxID=3238594 RepID=UPI003A0FC976
MEIFFGHLKSEIIYLSKTQGAENIINEINEYIWFYNNERIQLKYGMSPIQYKSHAA